MVHPLIFIDYLHFGNDWFISDRKAETNSYCDHHATASKYIPVKEFPNS